VSVPDRQLPPAASPNKPGHARGAPVFIHVSAAEGDLVSAPTSPPQARIISRNGSGAQLTSTPSLHDKHRVASLAGADSRSMTPPGAALAERAAPPSSTKRVLAPNGQPRKIPLAMDFNDVAACDLEDRDACEEDDWTVGTQHPPNRHTGSRVGALAAAAGRGASAFVEAFRSALGTHKSSYSGSSPRK
jgi:hypothetical protein